MSSPRHDTLLIVDGHALLHRAWHAIPPLFTQSGESVNAVYGFVMILMKVMTTLRPSHVVATFDLPSPTFRHEAYAEYKATREKKPDELYAQIDRIQEVLRAFGMPIFQVVGYEADDIIATIRDRAQAACPKCTVNILTGDMDALQLVDEHTSVYTIKKGVGDIVIYDTAAVAERYGGLTPLQTIDYKALRGDASDNIKGVKGIGEKTAIELLQKFGSLDGVYEAVMEHDAAIPGRISNLLREHELDARQSLELVKLVHTVPLQFSWEMAQFGGYDAQVIAKLFQELEFRTLMRRLTELAAVYGSVQAASGEHPPLEEGVEYVCADTPEMIVQVLEQLARQKYFALDTETTSLETVDAQLVGVSVSWEEKRGVYLPWNALDESACARLKEILEDDSIKKTGHNLKYDYEVLASHGIVLRGIVFDTMIAAYVLNPGSRSYSLDELSFSEFGVQKIPIESLLGTGKNQITMADVPVTQVADYAARDADLAWRLAQRIGSQIDEVGQRQLLDRFELPLIPVLADMELAGITLDVKFLKQLEVQNAEERTRLRDEIFTMAGSEFNVDSPLQLKKVLFEDLGLSPMRIRRGKTGLSTAAAELEKMRELHPIVDKILSYREVTKLANTYLEVLPEMVNQRTGRIHAKFNQTVAATGRLSSTNPNLQNIPVKTELGRQIRKAFVAEKGYSLVSADYSQIELRIAAVLSGDAKMIEVFQSGNDFHTATAAEMNDVPLEEVTKDMRRAAKAINFGILYGMGPQGVAESAGIPYPQAREFIDRYFKTYPKVREFLDTTIALARSLGYVETMFGRRRYFPDINASAAVMRAAAERAATNVPFQGTNADIMKLAMIALHDRLANEFPGRARLILQVHDELVFEVADEILNEVSAVIREEMESVVKIAVPLKVEINVAKNWGDLK